jgi:ABC-type multidrug transport system fused ATPase/permease subunit
MKNEKQNGAGDAGRVKNVLRLVASMRPYMFEMLGTILSTFLKHAANIASAGIVAYMAALGWIHGALPVLMHFFVGAFTVIVMGLAAVFVAQGLVPFALYPVVVLLATLLFSPLIEVCSVARNLGLVFAAANRLQVVFDTQSAVADEERPAHTASHGALLQSGICFDRVSFRYRPELAPVLREAGFEVKSGETVALAGPSGRVNPPA